VDCEKEFIAAVALSWWVDCGEEVVAAVALSFGVGSCGDLVAPVEVSWWVSSCRDVVAPVEVSWWVGSCRDVVAPVQLLAFSAAYVIMVGTYLSLPSAMADLFNRLWENGVIGDDHADTLGSLSYLEFVEKQVRWIGSRWSAAIALLVATLNPLFLVFVHPIWIGIPLWLELIVIILILE
jgi:hypothetical protein